MYIGSLKVRKYVGRSAGGLLTIGESGGELMHTGFAIVICGSKGEALTFLPEKDKGDHATFLVEIGMHIVVASHDETSEEIYIYRVDDSGAFNGADIINCDKVYERAHDIDSIPSEFKAAALAASSKAHCYGCTCIHYAR